MGVESEPLFMSLQSVLCRPHVSFTHGIYHETDLCYTGERRTNLGVTKHGLPTSLSYLTSDRSLAVNLFHPVLIQKKKKKKMGRGGGT